MVVCVFQCALNLNRPRGYGGSVRTQDKRTCSLSFSTSIGTNRRQLADSAYGVKCTMEFPRLPSQHTGYKACTKVCDGGMKIAEPAFAELVHSKVGAGPRRCSNLKRMYSKSRRARQLNHPVIMYHISG